MALRGMDRRQKHGVRLAEGTGDLLLVMNGHRPKPVTAAARVTAIRALQLRARYQEEMAPLLDKRPDPTRKGETIGSFVMAKDHR